MIDVRNIITIIETLIAKRAFGQLNQLLEDFDPKISTPLIMVAVLRSSYRARNILPQWIPCLRRIRKRLTETNVPNIDKLLIGLNDDK